MPTAEQLVSDIQRAMAGGDPARDLKEQLWNGCLDVVGRLASRYTRSACLSREDLITDGYVKFEQALVTFDPLAGVPFRGYLSTCVDRHFNDRASKRQEATVSCGLADLPDSPVPDRLLDREVAEQVDRVLLGLLPDDPQRQRKILAFRLRHLEGWSVEQIRRWLRVERANTVSQWIHRVRKAFAEEFPRRYPDYFGDLTACPGGGPRSALDD